jgi:putative two-component system response regulator
MQKIVFVVDDYDANLIMAATILEGEYQVLTMPSAEKMFFLMDKKRPSLILLDIEMPEMDGYGAIRKLKADPRTADIPVIFLI